MILFHAVSSFQLIEVTLLKLRKHAEEKSVLVVSLDVVNRLENYNQFLNFFDDIVVYDNGTGNQMVARGEDITVYFESVFGEKKISISDFDTIYLGCAHHSFGVYVAEQNIPYIFLEDGVGALSRPEVLHTVEKSRIRKDKLSLEYGLYDGSSENAVACIYNKNYQIEGFEHLDKYIHFDVYEELSAIDESNRSILLKIFTQLSNIPSTKESVLLLTEHFANLNLFTWEEQILLYQLLIDYFFSGYSLVFKPHPDDLMYYEELFPGNYIIKDRFPAEILPFLFEEKPQIVATVSSTAIYTLKSCFDNTIAFNYDFSHYLRQFKDLHRIYTALKISENISSENVYTFAFNNAVAENFIATGRVNIKNAIKLERLEDYLDTENGALIIDNCGYYSEENHRTITDFLSRLPDGKTVIFTNSSKEYSFYDYDKKSLLKNLHTIKIEKAITADECVDTPENEYLFCYTTGEFTCQEISIELKHTGESIHAAELTDCSILVKRLLTGMDLRLADILKTNEEYRSRLTQAEIKRVPVFHPEYDKLKSEYSLLDKICTQRNQEYLVAKGMLLATEKRYLYFLLENEYLKEHLPDDDTEV